MNDAAWQDENGDRVLVSGESVDLQASFRNYLADAEAFTLS